MNVLRSAVALGEVGLALSPWAPAPRPCWVDEIDADWLTSVLAAKVPAARVLSIEDLPGPGGRVTVGLEDGTTATVEPEHLPQEIETGDDVVLLKKTGEDGAVTLELEPPAK